MAKTGVFTPKFLGVHMNTTIGHNQFRNIPHCAAKFCENQFRDIKKSVGGKIPEGQHPLTGQRAANFRLLANQ